MSARKTWWVHPVDGNVRTHLQRLLTQQLWRIGNWCRRDRIEFDKFVGRRLHDNSKKLISQSAISPVNIRNAQQWRWQGNYRASGSPCWPRIYAQNLLHYVTLQSFLYTGCHRRVVRRAETRSEFHSNDGGRLLRTEASMVRVMAPRPLASDTSTFPKVVRVGNATKKKLKTFQSCCRWNVAVVNDRKIIFIVNAGIMKKKPKETEL